MSPSCNRMSRTAADVSHGSDTVGERLVRPVYRIVGVLQYLGDDGSDSRVVLDQKDAVTHLSSQSEISTISVETVLSASQANQRPFRHGGCTAGIFRDQWVGIA